MSVAADQPQPRRITLPQLALTVPWVAVVIAGFRTLTDNSFLWHVAAGEVQRGAAEVLVADPFSFTMRGEQWLTQSWLAELLYDALAGPVGVGFAGPMIVVASLMFLGGLGLVTFRTSKSLMATAIVLILTTILVTPFLVPRPVLFSFPLFALMILAWDRPAIRWTIPFLMWIWASVHGSFVIGLVLLGLLIVSRREWRAWPFLLAGGMATLLTPHGLGVVTMLLDFAAAKPYLDLLVEWRTPSFVSPTMTPFLVGLALLLYGAMRQRLSTKDLWVIVPFIFLAMSASRAVVTAWIGLVPFIGYSLRSVEWRWGKGFPFGAGSALAGATLMLPFLFIGPVDLDQERFPITAAESLADVATFHDDVAGGYLIYSRSLSGGVFLDDRAELYRERIAEFVEVREGRRGWEEVFARDGIEQALLRVGEPLVERLAIAGWSVTHQDPQFVVLRP